jgi:hypothetical protein
MSKIAKRNEILFKRLQEILESNTNYQNLEIAKIMLEANNNTIEENIMLLVQIKTGYSE